MRKISFFLFFSLILTGYAQESASKKSLLARLKQSAYAKSGGLLISDGRSYQLIPGKGFGFKTSFHTYQLKVSGSYANRKRYGDLGEKKFFTLQFPKILVLQSSPPWPSQGSFFYGFGTSFNALEYSLCPKDFFTLQKEYFQGFSGNLACGYEFFPGQLISGTGQFECSIPLYALSKSPHFASYPLFEISFSLGY